MVDQHFCTDLHAFRARPSRLPGKRARPVPRGRRRSNAPPLPDWRIWYYLLESAGLNVQLVNSRHARQLAGRPKTDQKDAQWIARLAEMGLLRPSFVPPPEIRALRDLARTRLQLLKDRTREWQRLEKLLEGALIKLSSVVYSMARNKTAWAILEAIVAGERDPKVPRGPHPRQHQGRQCRDRAGAGGHAPGGSPSGADPPAHGPHHLAGPAGRRDRGPDRGSRGRHPRRLGRHRDGVPSPDPGPDAAVLPAAERLAEIPGVSLKLAREIIAETGLDMTRFPTADHLVSWAGLAPVARQSGPRQRKPSKGQGDVYLRRTAPRPPTAPGTPTPSSASGSG